MGSMLIHAAMRLLTAIPGAKASAQRPNTQAPWPAGGTQNTAGRGGGAAAACRRAGVLHSRGPQAPKQQQSAGLGRWLGALGG